MVLKAINNKFTDLAQSLEYPAWTLFRVGSAAMFITHGYTKLFGANPQPFRGGGMTAISIGELISLPMPLAINCLFIAAVIEFFGGLLLLVGLYTQWTALTAAVLMLMAYLTAHLAWFPTLNNGELAALYFLVFLVLFSYGAGPYSLDNWLSRRRQAKRNREQQQVREMSGVG
ncbi:MAG: DoxX family protein [Pseudohongiellaceae bacterium]